MAGRTTPPFRHEPPELAAGLLVRPRLIEILRGRYEERLLVLSAGAGFGKTVLLGQAIAENELERFGHDVWLRIVALDRDPAHLLAGLYQSLTGRHTRLSVSAQDIAELVSERSPNPVAIMLDDVHLLGSSNGHAWRAVNQLLDQLPENAHVVLSGRLPPLVGLGRRQLRSPVVMIDESLLEFDDDELRRYANDGENAPIDSPRWPALAALSRSLGDSASAQFIRDEIVGTLHPERARMLALLALFGVIDDALVATVVGTSAWTAKRVVEGLPLVDRRTPGTFEIHKLWVAALVDHCDAEQHDAALVRGAAFLLERGEHVRSAHAAAAAGDPDVLHEAILRYCKQPMLNLELNDVLSLQSLLPESPDVEATALLLDGARYWAASEHTAASIFQRSASAAQVAENLEVEAVARWRLAQLQYLHDHRQLVVDDRLIALEDAGVRLATATAGFIRSVVAQRRGCIEEALAETRSFVHLDATQRQVTIAERLVDLGRLEEVTASLDSIAATGEIDIFAAQALWLRGEVDPELAWALAREFPARANERGIAHELVSVRGVVAMVAISAGEVGEALELVHEARRHETCVGDHVRLIVDVAEAMHALCADGDDRAREVLYEALGRVPLGRWPARGYLHGLAMLRALIPETADVLDTCKLGPALQTAVDAGAAIAALRDGSGAALAASLSWRQPNLLRAHVPPPCSPNSLLQQRRTASRRPRRSCSAHLRSANGSTALRALWTSDKQGRQRACLANSPSTRATPWRSERSVSCASSEVTATTSAPSGIAASGCRICSSTFSPTPTPHAVAPLPLSGPTCPKPKQRRICESISLT